jgi:hypothetical protein
MRYQSLMHATLPLAGHTAEQCPSYDSNESRPSVESLCEVLGRGGARHSSQSRCRVMQVPSTDAWVPTVCKCECARWQHKKRCFQPIELHWLTICGPEQEGPLTYKPQLNYIPSTTSQAARTPAAISELFTSERTHLTGNDSKMIGNCRS